MICEGAAERRMKRLQTRIPPSPESPRDFAELIRGCRCAEPCTFLAAFDRLHWPPRQEAD